MCGINGRFNFSGRPVSPDEIVAMRDVMDHRGPDGHGLFVDGAVGLGHRRLSIIDLEGGRQPLANEDGSVTIVFNGEIYNYRELGPRLRDRGHTFATSSDTEVIVHLYEDRGADCVEHLRGMFAFAIWDARKQELLLARDRLGVKPLYYTVADGALIFASEIKSLLEARGVAAELDPQGLRRYLAYRFPYGDGTLFKGIKQLPPGHVLTATAAGISIRQYWDAPQQSEDAAPADIDERFLSLLDEAVRLRMISDVPLGAFLSGGLDSSVVTALMARHTNRVKTFSIGFVPGEESELSWARTVADGCRADHHEFVQGPGDFFSLMQRLIWHHDEPMIFPASIPLYLLSRESKRVATVMLAGEGADEILAGYSNNVRGYWQSRLSRPVPGALLRLLAQLPVSRRVRSAASRLALDQDGRIAAAYRLAGQDDMVNACRVPLPPAAADDRQLLDEVGVASRQGSFLDRLLYFQLKTYLIALLMKQDKMSMAASIETRVPYLDHHLVGLAFSLPDQLKIAGRSGKHLLKRVARNVIPNEIIDRPKRGFPVPIAQWLREPGNPFLEVLLDGETARDGLLDPAFVRARVQAFLAGRPLSMELWTILNLELWRREFLTGARRVRAVAS